MNISITGAGAGTGKTYHLCELITKSLSEGSCRPGAFIATTYTKKAASELKERIRARLIQADQAEAAQRVEEALVGTVHSVCARILERFAFEAGISPKLRILEESLEELLLSEAIEQCCDIEELGKMERLSRKLGQIDARAFGASNWRVQVRDIISAARSNAINADQLAKMADQNERELTVLLPKSTDADLEGRLQAVIATAINNIPLNEDATQKTETALKALQQALSDLRGGGLKWSDWCKLSKLSAAKPSEADIIPINEAAAQYERHPKLRADISQYIQRIFGLAADAMAAFQERKKARGVLDYTDLEVLTLELLENEHVQACIANEYDLLLVDEFQDTSPIQLQLFVSLAGLVKEVRWVGDSKQAIYGFRGADPELMRLAEKKYQGKGKASVLDQSRRHRPELVDFFNSYFPEVFKKTHLMELNEVTMKVTRPAWKDPSPAIELWSLSSGRTNKNGSPSAVKNSEMVDCVVRGLLELKEKGTLVAEKGKLSGEVEELRPIRWQDIAILTFSNSKASLIASTLLANGIPSARKTNGLFSTPEAVLVLACLRWLHDANDSVATAEIISLEGTANIESWLEDRLDWVDKDQTGQWGLDGKLKSRLLASIAPLRDRQVLLTPSELLDAVLIEGDLCGLASQWGDERAARRRSNIEAIRGFAAQYESACLASSIAVSHAGFIIWCATLSSQEQDLIAFDESADAVQVMTWHGSKGLEWPIVICLDLDDEPRARIWNTSAVVSETPFNPEKPLEGRRIRFWPYPFGQQTAEVPLKKNAEETKIGKKAAASSACEQSRLQYVVMTRARDLLVFPQAGNKIPWFPERVQSDVFTLPAQNITADIVGSVRRRIRHLKPIERREVTSSKSSYVTWFKEPLPRKIFPHAELTPSSLLVCKGSSVGERISYAERIKISSGEIETSVGNAIHAVLAACLISSDDLLERTEKICTLHGVKSSAGEIVSAALAFKDFLQSKFHPNEILVEVPFSYLNEESQRIDGYIDLALLTDNGAVLIDHKSYQGSDTAQRSLTYSGQLKAYREALIAHGYPVHSSWIHFCTQGEMISIQ